MNSAGKPRLAVHKFSSCDGCQLALLNMGEALLDLAQQVELVHFAEAGPLDPEADVDIALVEGSISTAEDRKRIKSIRQHTRFLIAIGACATSGGPQALRNVMDSDGWPAAIYPQPEYVSTLAEVEPIAAQVPVDLELWGCPVNTQQVLKALRDLLSGVRPKAQMSSVCMECKRAGNVCVVVAFGQVCLGPLTHAGCGALCPAHSRGCYGCYGRLPGANSEALGQ